MSVQQSAGCIIGKDYPRPIVEHETVSKENMNRMKDAYANQDHYRALLEKQQHIPKPMTAPPTVSSTDHGHKSSTLVENSSENEDEEEVIVIDDDDEQNGSKKKKRKAPSSRLITDFVQKPSNSGSSSSSAPVKRTKHN